MTLTDPLSVGARAADDDIDIEAWIAGLRRRAGLFAGVAGLVALIVLAVLLGRPPAIPPPPVCRSTPARPR